MADGPKLSVQFLSAEDRGRGSRCCSLSALADLASRRGPVRLAPQRGGGPVVLNLSEVRRASFVDLDTTGNSTREFEGAPFV